MSLDVISGQYLPAQRPAVFIFNHRNLFDVFAAAALVRRDWTVVGTRRLLWRTTAEHPERMTPAQVRDTFDGLAGCALLADLLSGGERAGPILPFSRMSCPTLVA